MLCERCEYKRTIFTTHLADMGHFTYHRPFSIYVFKMSTLQVAKTQFITASNGVRFAYRSLGPTKGKAIPLVLHIHYRGNMDLWDPLLINSLAASRPVIIFDQAGVGRSNGEVANTFQGWADNGIHSPYYRMKQADRISQSLHSVRH
jgi:hypothetical protein